MVLSTQDGATIASITYKNTPRVPRIYFNIIPSGLVGLQQLIRSAPYSETQLDNSDAYFIKHSKLCHVDRVEWFATFSPV
ncbi:MAG: hypothetical protein CL936_16205 [Deltaproteobacteria bacterium]|nr:hypothetical protein [Deltaproteobacteria bacterium]